MKALVCEMCSSNDLVKQDGMYVCQHCGTKYTVEEAKKLMVEGTVKIDKTEETNKLLVLAQRARLDDDSKNAEKYYTMVLEDDPNNWEAYFFQIYYRATQSKVEEMINASNSVSNCIDTTLLLIREIPSNHKRDLALDTIIAYTNKISLMFTSAARNTYGQIKGAHTKAYDCVLASYSIRTKLETSIKKYFSNDNERITLVQELMVDHINSCKTYFGFGENSFGSREINRLTQEIQSTDSSYIPPTQSKTNTGGGGCYVATSVYGSYDCPQVWTLRRYRDDTLAKTWYGRAFIHTYYAISPTLVKWFGNTNWFKNMWKPKLDKMVSNLNSEGVENTPYEDKKW